MASQNHDQMKMKFRDNASLELHVGIDVERESSEFAQLIGMSVQHAIDHSQKDRRQ